MKKGDEQLIYIGKGKNLRNRIHSYFQEASCDGRRLFRALVRNIVDLDYIVTSTE